MGEQHIGVALGTHAQRRTGPHRDHANRDPAAPAELRKERIQQARIADARGGRQVDAGRRGRPLRVRKIGRLPGSIAGSKQDECCTDEREVRSRR